MFFSDNRQLNRIEAKLDALIGVRMAKIDDSIAALQTQVAKNTSVVGSAMTLIQGFGAQLAAAVAAAQAAGATPEELQAITDLGAQLQASDDALAKAVTDNTPAA